MTKSRQNGQEVPPYAAETAREIGTLGAGGHGNFESRSDAANRGVTRPRVEEAKVRASKPKEEGKAETKIKAKTKASKPKEEVKAAVSKPKKQKRDTAPEASGVMEPSLPAPHLSRSEAERAGRAMLNTNEKIREKAYELWILEGRPEGRHLAHWDMATELVSQEEGFDTTLLPINPEREEIEDAVAALDNGGEAPGLTDQGKDDSDALRASPPARMAAPAKKKAGRSKV